MTELVGDCPRCGANEITFDLTSAIGTRVEYDWKQWYEAFCICRRCRRSTIFVLADKHDADYKYLHKQGLSNIDVAANRFVKIEGVISLKDSASVNPPEHLPTQIEAIFREGATCLAVRCYNAAGTMFRLCIDLATIELLPEGDIEGLNTKTRRNLGLRLPWLFDHGHLPEALRDLSTCVREDGNDAAHAGTLTADDARDLLEFCSVLLERLYTEPAKLRIAEERRKERRAKQNSPTTTSEQ